MYCPVCHSEYPADWKACPKDATSLLKSAQIGKYRIEGLMGVGGMGAVYRATNPDIKGSRVAIKVMNPSVAGAEQTRERFKREAAAVAALRTSHVVKVFDFDTEPDGALYLVMELLDGHALRDEILPAPAYMDLARIQMVMDGALRGLAAAHKVGIVHRDLKPENIYVAETDDGEVPKLLDFGIARVRSQDKNLTHAGSLMGTASYMATEQIAADVSEIGPWSDVYAMGAILYEMLAGAPAFGGNTVTEVLQRVLKAECVPLASVRPGLPAEVYLLVDRCMSSTPAVRPQDAEAMRIALGAARLVPNGAPVPPPYKTRVDQVAPVHESSSGRSEGALGVMATEGYKTPLPNLTPPGLAGTAIGNPGGAIGLQKTPADGVRGSSTSALTARGPAMGADPGASSPGAIGTGPGVDPSSRVSAFGPTVGATTSSPPTGATGNIEVPKKKSKLPLVIGGVAVLGIGAVVAAKVMGGGGGGDKPIKHHDAGVVASIDAAPPVADAAVVAVIDAAPADPLPELTSAMVHFDGGKHKLGEDPKPSPNALKLDDYQIGEFWIDKEEMTLGGLRAALKNTNAGGVPGDQGLVPARNVSWAQASDACKALGKRLPSEYEWERAALDTPNKKELATLKSTTAKLSAPKHEGCTPDKCDCSAAGLCDMLGGVVEWTADGPGKKMVRGSGHTVSPTEGWMATIHFRMLVDPAADAEVGFRCAWSKGTPGPKVGEVLKPTPTPTPTPVPTPKPPAANKCDDVDGLYRAARDAFANGQYAAAITKGEQAIACKPEERGYTTIAMAACKMKNASKAKAALANIMPGRGGRQLVKRTCADEGIEVEGPARKR